MKKHYRFYVVDDDRISVAMTAKQLEKAGYGVSCSTSSVSALPEIIEQQPDCVIADLMMPEMDGLEMIKRLRSEPALKATKIVVVSAKSYEFDRKHAFALGADGYIIKPLDPKNFVEKLLRVIEDRIELAFWGVHGTLPVPSDQTTKYGGNTPCVSLDFSNGNLFVFDAGTGIKALSDHLAAENRSLHEVRIFISHPHWDHINALPFFAPLYMQGKEIEIYGPSHGDITVEQMISGQMDGFHFPIKIKEFSASIKFRDLKEEHFEVDGKIIKTMLLNHPGSCLGYRVQYKDRSVCYVTDNELYPINNQYYNQYYLQRMVEFVSDTNALITDVTYNDAEYESRVGWGHSAVGQVVALADQANVKTLYLFHHDPDQTDADIDFKLEMAQAQLSEKNSATTCIAPREKERFVI